MDANTRKFTATALTALMLGTVFVAAIAPTAVAQLTAADDVYVDIREARQTVPVHGVGSFTDISVPTNPVALKLRHSTAYDLIVVGIDTGATTGYGYAGAASRVELVNTSGTAAVLISTDVGTGPTATTRNATFLIQTNTVPGPGVYELRPQGSTNTIAKILFYPKEDLTVSVSTATTPTIYTPAGNTVVTVRTSDSTGNIAAALTDCDVRTGNTKTCIGFLPASNATGTDGSFVFVSALPMGAGTWPIYAFHNNTGAPGGYYNASNGDSIPERLANTTFSVAPVTLGLTTVQATAFVGFSSAVAYRPTFPATGNSPFKVTGTAYPNDATVQRYNITVASPTGNVTSFNTTMPAAGTGTLNLTATVTPTCYNTTANTMGCGTGDRVPYVHLNRENGDIWINSSDDRDGFNVWTSGTYTVTVQLETAGGTIGGGTAGSMTPPEYTVSTTLGPAAPAAVNLEASPTTVNVPAPIATLPTSSTTFSNAQGIQVLTLTISGDTAFRHPACNRAVATDACSQGSDPSSAAFPANITLSGAILPGWNVTSYTPATGVATIWFTPSSNGTVTVSVNWNNRTTTMAIPINNGAASTIDTPAITVDTTSTVGVTIKNAFGGNVENANVYLFPRQALAGATNPLSAMQYTGTGASVVFGTGAVGQGKDGIYSFNLKPSAVQDLVFVGVIGSGTSNVNYTYVDLRVLPNTDLAVTLNVNNTKAAYNTHLVMNVTNGTGVGQTSTDANFKVYFLTAAQKTNLLTNGTTALFTTGTIPTATATAGSSATGTNLNVSLAAGDYNLYVCSGTSAITDCRTAVRDNRDTMPVFNVSAYNVAFTPPQIANNPDIQGATVVHVMVTDSAGNRANGTVTVRANGTFTTSGTGLSFTVTNGEANVTLTGANTGIGNIEFNFDPTETTSPIAGNDRLMGSLGVVAGNLTISPAKISILQSTLVTAFLTNFTGSGLPGRVIRLCGVSLNSNFPSTFPTTLSSADQTNCTAVGTTDTDGSAGIVVTPSGLSAIGVYVNNSYTARTIPVTAGTLTVLVSPTAPAAGDSVTLTVSQPGGAPSVGSRLLVVRDGTTVLDQTADGNGQAKLTNVVAGNYTVTGIRSGFDNGTATFTVGAAAPTTAAKFALSNLVIPSTVTVGTPVTVSVDVSNTGDADGTATALLLVNNAQRDTASVTLEAGAKQTVAYTFTPTVAGTFAVSVKIGSVEVGPTNIVVESATTTTTTTTTPDATTTTPPTTTTTTTPATTTTTTPATTTTTTTPSVPGFEVVALIAALGVALLVFRRKNE